MKKNVRWPKIMALGLSLSSTIMITAWGTMKLAKLQLIDRGTGFVILLAVVFCSLGMMFYHATGKKNSS